MTPTFFSKELTGKQKQDGIFNPRFALQNTSITPLNPDLIDTPYFERKKKPLPKTSTDSNLFDFS